MATPTAGSRGLRDPFILRKQDGTFVVLATDLNGTDWSYQSQYLHVWDSADLRTFSNYRLLKVHSLATHAWAPEAYWDAARGQYAVVYSAVVGGHNVLMVNYTSDFVTASAPQVFFDPGYDAIDGNFVTVGGVNYMYFKNNTNSTLLGTRSSTLNPGSFSVYTGAIGPGRGVEAPQIVKSNTANVWYMWGDTWSPNGRFFCWQTTRRRRRLVDPAQRPGLHPAAELQAPRHHPDHRRRAVRPHQHLGHARLEPDQVLQLPGPLRPAREQRRPHRRVPVRPVPGSACGRSSPGWPTRPGSRSGR